MIARSCLVMLALLWLPPLGGSTVLGGSHKEDKVAEPLFIESAAATGLTFTHVNGATGKYYLPEQMGAGVALCDYDNDGDLAVFLFRTGRSPTAAHLAAPTTRPAGCFATI